MTLSMASNMPGNAITRELSVKKNKFKMFESILYTFINDVHRKFVEGEEHLRPINSEDTVPSANFAV